jgi:hypothetical protein
MKKIFTLVAMAAMAIGVNAQETPTVWDSNSEEGQNVITNSIANPTSITNDNFFSIPESVKIYPEGTYAAGGVDVTKIDGAVAPDLKLYEFSVTKGDVTLHAVSTPNSDAKADEAWQMSGGGNKGLNTDACPVKFEKFVKPKNGNPSISYKEYYETTTNGTSFRVNEDYWTPEANTMPGKGNYYEFTTKSEGSLIVGIRVNRPTDALYVFEKGTFTQLEPSKLSIDGYVNNNTVIWGTNTDAFSTIKMNAEHTYQQDGIPGKEIFGFLTIAAAANTTYVMLSPKGQIGLFGFQFTGTTGIESVKAAAELKADAPIYNLAGQKVDAAFKGMVIQNGRKFINK